MRRIVVSFTVFACLLTLAACADSTAPPLSRASKPAPRSANHTRYILATGDTPPPGCTDVGGGYWECGIDGAQVEPATLTNPAAQANTAR